MYDTMAVHVMSGTGNSLRAARQMAALAQDRGLKTSVSLVERGVRLDAPPCANKTLVGFCFPAHGFTAPWLMIRFAALSPWGGGVHAFVLVTRGGTKFGPLFFPGMEGTAAYLIALLLVLRGCRVRGVLGLDMPSNWTSLHSGFREENARAIMEHSAPRLAHFTERLLDGKKAFGGFICLLLGLLLLPLSVAYLLFGRFFLAKLFFANTECNGCGQCMRNCPAQAIRMRGRPSRPYWTVACESCMRCMAYCPRQAIEAGHSWGLLLWLAVSLPMAHWIQPALLAAWPWLGRLEPAVGHWLLLLLTYPAYLFLLCAAYVLFWAVIRMPWLNMAFSYTTLTHLYRRYHEPGTPIDALHKLDK